MNREIRQLIISGTFFEVKINFSGQFNLDKVSWTKDKVQIEEFWIKTMTDFLEKIKKIEKNGLRATGCETMIDSQTNLTTSAILTTLIHHTLIPSIRHSIQDSSKLKFTLLSIPLDLNFTNYKTFESQFFSFSFHGI